MRKVLLFLILSAIGQAAPIGNTASPALIRKGFFTSSSSTSDWKAGYEGDFVSDARLKQFEEGLGRVDEYVQLTNSGTVTLNFPGKVDLYGVLGTSQAKANWRFTDSAGSIHRIKIETSTLFLWAVGARGIYYQWCGLDLGVGGRYTCCSYQPTSFTSDGVNISPDGAHFHWTEWQINLDFSYTIRLFTPYIGVKYSHNRTALDRFPTAISQSGTGSNHFKNRQPVGLYLGCGLSNGDYFMCNIEGRLIDEESITLSADFRF